VGRFITHTVFDKQWATLTIDEFHEFRSRSSGYWAVLSLAEKAKIIVGATATPLFNGFQDLTNLGRLLRIPAFQGDEGDQLDKELKSEVHKAERMLTPAEKAQARSLVSQVQRGLGESEVDASLTDAQESVQSAMMTTIQTVRKCWGHHIIRRTNDSVKDDGTPINSEMPECRRVYVYVELDETEHVQLSEHVTELVGE
jgi:mannose-6-phosphate isomerase class I